MQAVLSNPKLTVVRPQGSLNAANALELERDLTAALRLDDSDGMLVNLANVESMDSAGLMALVSTLKQAQSINKRFSICCVSPALRIIFELTQLDSVFEILPDETALTSV
ncbi:MAG: STAS domain-containing protein [Calothrix sp. C42_A2020_038]|nr:STAS domain-containing protein [Calothrix sp. C42_A2020_038]